MLEPAPHDQTQRAYDQTHWAHHRTQRAHDQTHWLIWCLAIICTILTILVILAGIAIFIGYSIIKPKIPFVSVTNAHLDYFNSDQAGVLTTRLTIVFKAENDNRKASASFTDFRYELSLNGIIVARLVNNPFDVGNRESKLFNYVVVSDSIPLDPDQMAMVDRLVKRNRVGFELVGHTRARWRVGPFGSVRFWLRLDCELEFYYFGGNTTGKSHCNSKSK